MCGKNPHKTLLFLFILLKNSVKISLSRPKKPILVILLLIGSLPLYLLPQIFGYAFGETNVVQHCPAMITDVTLEDATGFVTVNERYKDQNGVLGLYDFVLKPNSSGQITILYDFREYRVADFMASYHTTLAEVFGPKEEVKKLVGAGFAILPVEKAGISIYASDITNMTEHIIKVTYTVKAEHNAEKGTYLIDIFQTCPGELITVGEKPYEGLLPWDPKLLPPLSQPTTSGKFSVDISWSPVDIEPGKLITIYVMIRDEQQFVIKDAQYDFVISDASGKVLLDERNVTTTLGQGTHEVTFESAGTARITVAYLGSLSDLENKITERAEFDLIVVPEFPLGVAVVTATVVAITIAVTRLRNITISKQ